MNFKQSEFEKCIADPELFIEDETKTLVLIRSIDKNNILNLLPMEIILFINYQNYLKKIEIPFKQSEFFKEHQFSTSRECENQPEYPISLKTQCVSLKEEYTVNIRGEKHGIYKEYYRNGTIAIKIKYRNGKYDGPFQLFNQDGTISSRYIYKDNYLLDMHEEFPEGESIGKSIYHHLKFLLQVFKITMNIVDTVRWFRGMDEKSFSEYIENT